MVETTLVRNAARGVLLYKGLGNRRGLFLFFRDNISYNDRRNRVSHCAFCILHSALVSWAGDFSPGGAMEYSPGATPWVTPANTNRAAIAAW